MGGENEGRWKKGLFLVGGVGGWGGGPKSITICDWCFGAPQKIP